MRAKYEHLQDLNDCPFLYSEGSLKMIWGREKGMRAEILSKLGTASAIVFEMVIHLLKTSGAV